jgi:Nuclease-related domain
MAGKRHEGERAGCCDQADGSCVGLAVRRLSQQRLAELAEEIWTASTGNLLPVRPSSDPRGSRPGASARAAYQRCRQQELEAWRPGRWWRAGAAVAGAIVAGLLIGMVMGAWIGWAATLLVALLAGWRLRFRPSGGASVWRRQAVLQRRTAGALQPLQQEGYLVMHDITLPGWPASLDHLVVGATGIWVIESRRGPLAARRKGTAPWRANGDVAAPLRGLRSAAAAIADALAGDASFPVRPLLCVHGAIWPGSGRSVEGITLVTLRQLAGVVRQGSPPLPPPNVQRATARALEVLRPAV